MIERIVGIDFGTSTSVIRVKRYENGIPVGDTSHVLPVTFNMGSTVVPTLIRESTSGKSYGYDAQIPKRNSTTYQNFKVDLESEDPEKKQEARKLTREFFTYLAKVYNEQSAGGYLGDNTDKVRTLISFPVKWSDETKKFMIETAKEAGFSNVEGMDEAQAAISAVLVQNVEHFEKYGYLDGVGSVNIMLIDMGAGTTDLVLCKYYVKEKKTEIICTWPKEGNILFGGKEVDEILRGYIESKLPEEESEGILRRCGLEKFKAWKENFISPALKKNESVDEFSELDMLIDMIGTEAEDYTVNRAVFEEQAKNYLGKFTTLINGCIEESETDPGDVDLVILTGGHSQWYFVEEILSGKMNTFGEISLKKVLQDNNRIIPIIRPQETVSMGLVYSELKQELVVALSSSVDPIIENPEAPKVEKIGELANELSNAVLNKKKVCFSSDNNTEKNNHDAITEKILKEASKIAKEVYVDDKDMPYTPESEFLVVNKGDGCIITKYTGKRSIVSIPDTINGKLVIAIGEYSFGGVSAVNGNKYIETVVIPESVTEIAPRAFTGCINLQKIVAHRNIRKIGSAAFYGCNKMQIADFDMGVCVSGKVTFPPALKEIGAGAFARYKFPYGTRRGIFAEVFISKNTVVRNSAGWKTFHPVYTTIHYYD